MHRVALLLLIGVAMCSASENCCSAGDRNKIRKEWSGLFENQDAKFRAGVARLLLLKVVEENPDAKALFKNVDIDNPMGGVFTAHAMRIFNALDMVINLLPDPESLDEALDHLADQHFARPGVKKAYFASFGKALERGLPKILDKFDLMAWRQCYGYILRTIASKLPA
jgi:hypothetical protein